MKKIVLISTVLAVVVFGSACAFAIIKKQVSTNNNLFKNLPENWTTSIRDSQNCYSVNIFYQGSYDDSIQNYVKDVVDKRDTEVVDQNIYGIESNDVLEKGQQGVDNFNTIFLKSSSNDIYMVEVNGIISEFDNRDTSTCEDPQVTAKAVVNSLLQ